MQRSERMKMRVKNYNMYPQRWAFVTKMGLFYREFPSPVMASSFNPYDLQKKLGNNPGKWGPSLVSMIVDIEKDHLSNLNGIE